MLNYTLSETVSVNTFCGQRWWKKSCFHEARWWQRWCPVVRFKGLWCRILPLSSKAVQSSIISSFCERIFQSVKTYKPREIDNKKVISSSITLVAHDFFQFLKFFSSSSKFPNQKRFYWKQFSNKRLVFIWRMCSWMFVKWHIPNVTNVTFQMSQIFTFQLKCHM